MKHLGEPQRFRVEAEGAGKRLDSWLSSVTAIPRSEIQRLIGLECVRVAGAPVNSKSLRLREGDEVEVVPAPPPRKLPEPEYEIRFEDRHLAIVAKPAGVVVHPAPGVRSGTLVEALAKRMPLALAAGQERPGVVHRLDKGTSGLLIFAKTDEAHEALVRMMKNREVERTYIALVSGRFQAPLGRVEAPVGRSPNDPRRMRVTSSGREAITSFRVLEEIKDASLIEVSLGTGRTHQIRVHLAHIGHPVVGDADYGKRTESLNRKIGLRRPFLHAWRLRFTHPIYGAPVDVTEDLPEDLTEALRSAREGGAAQ